MSVSFGSVEKVEHAFRLFRLSNSVEISTFDSVDFFDWVLTSQMSEQPYLIQNKLELISHTLYASWPVSFAVVYAGIRD